MHAQARMPNSGRKEGLSLRTGSASSRSGCCQSRHQQLQSASTVATYRVAQLKSQQWQCSSGWGALHEEATKHNMLRHGSSRSLQTEMPCGVERRGGSASTDTVSCYEKASAQGCSISTAVQALWAAGTAAAHALHCSVDGQEENDAVRKEHCQHSNRQEDRYPVTQKHRQSRLCSCQMCVVLIGRLLAKLVSWSLSGGQSGGVQSASLCLCAFGRGQQLVCARHSLQAASACVCDTK